MLRQAIQHFPEGLLNDRFQTTDTLLREERIESGPASSMQIMADST